MEADANELASRLLVFYIYFLNARCLLRVTRLVRKSITISRPLLLHLRQPPRFSSTTMLEASISSLAQSEKNQL